MFRLAVALTMLVNNTSGLAARNDTAPQGSWEHWLHALHSGGKNGLPGRPDGQALEAPLPLWVDCHLSWYLDRPEIKKSSLYSKIVLRSGSKVCQGQLEEWAL